MRGSSVRNSDGVFKKPQTNEHNVTEINVTKTKKFISVEPHIKSK